MRGIGQDIEKNFIRDTILEKQLDFVGLQETIRSDFTKNELHNLAGGRNFLWEWIAPRGKSGGILVGINSDCFELQHVEKGTYFVIVLLFDKKQIQLELSDYLWGCSKRWKGGLSC